MKMHEIIKKRRLEKNLTQEQIAQFLGVSTPAVNKWEKGVSQTKGYREITCVYLLANKRILLLS